MLLAVTFHHHTEVEGNAATTYYCYDCAHHIHHDGHFVNGNTMHDCALCVLQSMTYVAPSFAQLTTFVVVLNIVYCAICILIKRCRYDVKSRVHLLCFLDFLCRGAMCVSLMLVF